MITTMLVTLISHLTGDFVLQTDNIAKGRDSYDYKGITRIKRSILYNLIHGTVHGFILYILIDLINFICETNLKLPLRIIVIISFIHFLIDLFKPIFVSLPIKASFLISKLFILLNLGSSNTKHNKGKINFIVFIIDQVLHISSIFIIFQYTLGVTPNCIYSFIISLPNTTKIHDKALTILLVLIFSTFGVAFFSKLLLDSLKKDSYNNNSSKTNMISDLLTLTREKSNNEEAKKGGFIIGILERLFIILGIVTKHPSVVAIVLTVKSIARYKKFGNDSFVEYYIMGTFLSFVFAILAGTIIAKIL